jgi:hypothetical protein
LVCMVKDVCTQRTRRDGFSSFAGKTLLETNIWTWFLMCASILREMFFPSGDIFNCQLKKGSYCTCQSLWAGIQTFKRPNRKIATRRWHILYSSVLEPIDVNGMKKWLGRWFGRLMLK